KLRLARGEHVVTIGRPGRRREKALLVLRQRPRIRAVRVGDIEVLGSVAVADEGEPLSVGGIARLAVEGHSGRDRLGLAASDRDGVKVPEQLKEDRLAVWGNVERDPRPFVGGKLNCSIGLEREALRLFLRLVLLVLGLRLFLALVLGNLRERLI